MSCPIGGPTALFVSNHDFLFIVVWKYLICRNPDLRSGEGVLIEIVGSIRPQHTSLFVLYTKSRGILTMLKAKPPGLVQLPCLWSCDEKYLEVE